MIASLQTIVLWIPFFLSFAFLYVFFIFYFCSFADELFYFSSLGFHRSWSGYHSRGTSRCKHANQRLRKSYVQIFWSEGIKEIARDSTKENSTSSQCYRLNMFSLHPCIYFFNVPINIIDETTAEVRYQFYRESNGEYFSNWKILDENTTRLYYYYYTSWIILYRFWFVFCFIFSYSFVMSYVGLIDSIFSPQIRTNWRKSRWN